MLRLPSQWRNINLKLLAKRTVVEYFWSIADSLLRMINVVQFNEHTAMSEQQMMTLFHFISLFGAVIGFAAGGVNGGKFYGAVGGVWEPFLWSMKIQTLLLNKPDLK